eukprot:gb/GECG01012449.1/.p1 GENE.gb/GECG01012449.1/~~gb/GECG01012449.1/.p1  ORF type:complete len:101 (+),score=7.31 gb/GECG01012449.1/:1-303(+)
MDITGASSLPAQASRIFRVRKTASRMLYKRGYNVPEEDLEMDGHDFRERFGTEPKGDDLTLLVCGCSVKSGSITRNVPAGRLIVWLLVALTGGETERPRR